MFCVVLLIILHYLNLSKSEDVSAYIFTGNNYRSLLSVIVDILPII